MLSVRQLSTENFANRQLFKLNFAVGRGEITAVLGHNGSGKSLLIETLAGLKSFSGEVRINRFNLAKEAEKAKAHLGYLPNPVRLELCFTGFEFLEIAGAWHNLSAELRRTSILDYAKTLGCHDQLFSTIEKNGLALQQRLALIASLIHQPAVLLLDEPLLHLDYLSRLKAMILIEKAAKAGASVLLATNDLSLASSLADRLVILKEGEMAFEGTIKQLANQLGQKRADLGELYYQISDD